MAKKKAIDLSSLIINRIIIHDIPKHTRAQKGTTPYYSEQDTHIPDGTKMFFKDKIINALQSNKAFHICFDETKDSPVPIYVKDLMTSGDDIFISHSKKIADRLLNVQCGVNTAGILLVIDGIVEQKRICILMKLEKDNGLQLERNRQTSSFDIKEIQDLMLTNKTKLYKIVLFLKRRDFSASYDGVLIDFQVDIKAKKEIQTFFMVDFLGCKPYKDPKTTTRDFYKYTKVFIEEMIKDKVIQTKYVQDLNSYMQKNQNTISPKEFADDYFIEPEHKDNYKKYIQEKKIQYPKAYIKDISLIDKIIKKIMVIFDNDIAIIGSKGTLDKKVEFSKLDDGRDRAEIISKIKKVS
ncbi:MAG: nucleoid-associated protein [Campylobacteraceae bacterium]|nr:nucleoid-associated protein [Campylobacteraceae bacterium]